MEKITTRRREGVGVVVEKMKKVNELSTKNSCDLLTAITYTEILVALYKANKQFNKKNKIMKEKRSICLDDVTTAPIENWRKINMNF